MTAQLLHVGGTARGHLPSIVDPVDGITALAPDSITYTIRRAGSDTAETLSSLTSLATGVYEWAYNPAAETEGEQISIRFVITVTDSNTDTHSVTHTVDLVVVAVERGTDSANTTAPLDAAGTRAAVGLANADLDDQIATLSTYDGSDTAGTSTLLSRLTSTRAGYLDNLTNLDAAISSLNNLSALANLYGSPLLEIPDSGSINYAFTLVVRDNEGKLKNLDASPTIAAANASGTDRSANLSAVSNPSTGRYTFTYSVASTAVLESLRITCSGTISAEARYVEWIGAIVDYDTVTTLAAIKAKTDNLPADPADQSDVEAAITSAVSTIRGADSDTLKTLSDQIDGIGGGGGSSLSGPYNRTITVTDADTDQAIQNATVRLYRTGETGTTTTNVSGVASFTVEAATWTYAITANGYVGTAGTVVVSADGNTAVSLTAQSITPSTGSFTTGYLTTYDNSGEVESGVSMNIQMTIAPSGTGVAYDSAITTVVSDANGLVEFPGMAKGGTYWLWRGTTSSADYETGVEVAIASGAGSTTALTNVAGDP